MYSIYTDLIVDMIPYYYNGTFFLFMHFGIFAMHLRITFDQFLLSLGIEPMTQALQAQCSSV